MPEELQEKLAKAEEKVQEKPLTSTPMTTPNKSGVDNADDMKTLKDKVRIVYKCIVWCIVMYFEHLKFMYSI